MPLRRARLAAVALALAAAACARATPRGAEAAAHAAETPAPVLAATVPQAAPVPSAQDFVSQASASDAFEIAAAQIAEQQAQDQAVKTFAGLMIHDHMGSAVELKNALASAGQSLAAAPGPAADQQARLDALRRTPVAGFDKAYVDGQVQAHQAALALMQAYAQNGDVVALKAFAGKAAAVVQRHLSMAQGLAERLP